MSKFWTIIPELISFETPLRHIKGLNIAERFDYFPATSSELPLHYKLDRKSRIKFPDKYDFRHGWYAFKEGNGYYERRLGPLDLKFCIDLKKRTVHFNETLGLVPFEIGGIRPIGYHLSGLIQVELLAHHKILIRGCATIKSDKTYVFIAPSFNGKTTLVQWLTQNGHTLISEDLFIYDSISDRIFPVGPHIRNYGRLVNQGLAGVIGYDKSAPFDDIQLFINTASQEPLDIDLESMLGINARSYLCGDFAKAVAIYMGLWSTIENNYLIAINKLKGKRIFYDQISNYDFKELKVLSEQPR